MIMSDNLPTKPSSRVAAFLEKAKLTPMARLIFALDATMSRAANAALYDKLSFNLIRDIAPVAGIVRALNVMVINPSFPAKSVPEFIAYAKANPGNISMASVGIGSGTHLYGELFKMMAGVDMVHVPYRSAGPVLTDLLGGQVQVYFASTVASIEYIRAGRLRALAVTTATRSDALPGIPTMGEFVPGYEASTWYGVGAPKATPAEIVDKLNRRSTRASPIPRCEHGLPTLEARRLSSRPLTSAR
jgi:tripartite-type tricarboxylate transporter receptor subunit TctC